METGITLEAGDRMTISATGKIHYMDAKQANGPEGLPRAWKDLIRILPLNESGRGALLARIGDDEAAQPILIGAKREVQARTAGRLFIGINQRSNEVADGSFHVTIEVTRAAPAAATSRQAAPAAGVAAQVPGLTPEVLAKIPRRVTDKDGDAGDMVNFFIFGSEAGVRRIFESAGWVRVDRTTRDAVLHGLLASVSKQSYTQMPMSELYLFGRPQDYGYAHAEPLTVAATRHHLRLWKAPFPVDGQTLWVGAATHDMGFERDQRTGSVTHHIDSNVDEEREFLGRTLDETGILANLAKIAPADAVTEARTATGGTFHSNGQIMVMRLAEAGADRSTAFANLFCAVLQQEHPDAGEWGACKNYLETPRAEPIALGALPGKYRILIVPGFMSMCTSATPAFQEGQAHLREKHGLTVDLLPVPNDSSESNGEIVARFLKDQIRKDPRKFIVLGYSKGAPDVQAGLAANPEAAAAVAAFATVAGAVGGSPIADVMPAQADRWINALHLGSCEGNLSAAFESLRRSVRQAFLTDHPSPIAPTFSLVAVSDEGNTSKLLRESWKLLAAFDSRQDSQLAKFDAIVPGAEFLGAARADHFAVALPFEFAADQSIRAAADHNHYPRAALLEALIRYVVQSLEPKP